MICESHTALISFSNLDLCLNQKETAKTQRATNKQESYVSTTHVSPVDFFCSFSFSWSRFLQLLLKTAETNGYINRRSKTNYETNPILQPLMKLHCYCFCLWLHSTWQILSPLVFSLLFRKILFPSHRHHPGVGLEEVLYFHVFPWKRRILRNKWQDGWTSFKDALHTSTHYKFMANILFLREYIYIYIIYCLQGRWVTCI